MGLPAFLVRNFFSRRIYPLHVLAATASSGAGEVAGQEFLRVGDGNRDPFDYWTNETGNTQVIGKVTCDRSRAANLVALDRGHNLAGKQVLLECSDDDFGTTQVVLDVVLPTAAGSNHLDNPLGVRTEEGAWLHRFPARSAKYWRLRVPALGAGLRPQVVGLWLDLSWAPGALSTPIAPAAHELGGAEDQTDAGWAMRSGLWTRRQGTVALRLPSVHDYPIALDHLQYQFGQNRPMWLVHDDEQAAQAVLAVPVLGTIQVEERRRDWFYPYAEFQWIEHQGKEAA